VTSKTVNPTFHNDRSTQGKPILFDQFDVKKLSIPPFEMEKEGKSKNQFMTFPKYENRSVIFQTPEFRISQYGIPELGMFGVTDDSKRSSIKLPFDPDQPECVMIEKTFSVIDNYVKEKQNHLFGKFAKLYEYKTLVKEPAEREKEILDDEDEKKK